MTLATRPWAFRLTPSSTVGRPVKATGAACNRTGGCRPRPFRFRGSTPMPADSWRFRSTDFTTFWVLVCLQAPAADDAPGRIPAPLRDGDFEHPAPELVELGHMLFFDKEQSGTGDSTRCSGTGGSRRIRGLRRASSRRPAGICRSGSRRRSRRCPSSHRPTGRRCSASLGATSSLMPPCFIRRSECGTDCWLVSARSPSMSGCSPPRFRKSPAVPPV